MNYNHADISANDFRQAWPNALTAALREIGYVMTTIDIQNDYSRRLIANQYQAQEALDEWSHKHFLRIENEERHFASCAAQARQTIVDTGKELKREITASIRIQREMADK